MPRGIAGWNCLLVVLIAAGCQPEASPPKAGAASAETPTTSTKSEPEVKPAAGDVPVPSAESTAKTPVPEKPVAETPVPEKPVADEVPQPEAAARSFVALLVDGQFSKATESFDPTMSKAMPEAKLAETWRTTVSGAYRKTLGAKSEHVNQAGREFDVVVLTCEFEKGAYDVRVVLDAERKVAGLFFSAAKPPAVGKQELWLGDLDAGALKLKLLIRLGKTAEGKDVATFDSLDQGQKDLVFDSVQRDDKSVRLESTALKAVFEGKFSEDRTQLSGEWKQGGQTLPATFKPVDAEPQARRPQMPKPPFKYASRDVKYENAAGGTKLAGTLTVPEGPGPHPAAILITGSGPQDRDETLFGHKPFLVLADALTRRGVAVLRVDDRGIGGSTGNVGESTHADFAGDVLAGIAFLKSQTEIDPKRIGLVGHSEGGLVGPLAATKSEDVAFLVLLAGPGWPGRDILFQQGAAILKAGGADDAALVAQRTLQERLFGIMDSAKDDEEAKQQMVAAIVEQVRADPKTKDTPDETAKASAEGQAAQLLSPWFRTFLKHDPREALRQVKCPVLALNGELDLQVLPKENLGEIRKALTEAGNTDFETVELPGLNHLFQTAKTGHPGEYGTIEETISPAALDAVGDWIAKRFVMKPAP